MIQQTSWLSARSSRGDSQRCQWLVHCERWANPHVSCTDLQEFIIFTEPTKVCMTRSVPWYVMMHVVRVALLHVLHRMLLAKLRRKCFYSVLVKNNIGSDLHSRVSIVYWPSIQHCRSSKSIGMERPVAATWSVQSWLTKMTSLLLGLPVISYSHPSRNQNNNL